MGAVHIGAVLAQMSRGQVTEFCVGAVVAMAFGSLFVIQARLMRRKLQRLRRVGRTTSAVVVDYEYKRNSQGERTRYPRVQFQTPDGRLVTARTDFGGDFVPAVGDHVEVLFDPERPQEAHLESQLSDQVNSLIGIVGWVIIIGAVVAAVIVLVVFRDVWT
jgi:Protein of unknown function (DUF3592)